MVLNLTLKIPVKYCKSLLLGMLIGHLVNASEFARNSLANFIEVVRDFFNIQINILTGCQRVSAARDRLDIGDPFANSIHICQKVANTV